MSAGPLKALQRRFVRSVTFLPDADLIAGVTGGGTLTAAEAVDVYRRGYPARLTEALGETFEACWRVLGDEDFFAACRDFIARTPSQSHNLSDYGAAFPEFLESRPESDAAAFLGDLARYEWTFKELFHEKPHASLSAQALAAKVRPNSTLRFGGAVRLSTFRHRVHGIWKRDRADETPLEDAEWTGSERLVLYKKEGNSIFVRELTAPEHAALSGLAAGRPLDEALAAAEGLDDAGAAELFAFVADSAIVTEVR